MNENNDLKILLDELKELLGRNQKETLSIKEAATYSGIGHETIRALVNKKNSDFPFFIIFKKVIIKRSLLDEWLEKVSIEHRNI